MARVRWTELLRGCVMGYSRLRTSGPVPRREGPAARPTPVRSHLTSTQPRSFLMDYTRASAPQGSVQEDSGPGLTTERSDVTNHSRMTKVDSRQAKFQLTEREIESGL